MKVSIVCFTVFFFIGCKEKTIAPVSESHFPHGMYSGKYLHTANGMTDTGMVEMVFQDTVFQCIPLRSEHLLPGKGVYDFLDDTLEIQNLSSSETNHDLELVMNGKYSYITEGKNLVLVQQSESKRIIKRFELTRTN